MAISQSDLPRGDDKVILTRRITDQPWILRTTSTRRRQTGEVAGPEHDADGLFVGWLLASVSQGRICTDKYTWCHTETEVADKTFHLTQSQ